VVEQGLPGGTTRASSTRLHKVQIGEADRTLLPLKSAEVSALVNSLGDLNALWSNLPMDQRQAFGHYWRIRSAVTSR
jgi:hypothetical protein